MDVAVKDYNLYRRDRIGGGGGVVTYVKSGFLCKKSQCCHVPKCSEFLALKIQLGPTSVIVVVIYRPPSTHTSSTDKIADLLSQYSDVALIVVGDFNLNWLNLNPS